MFNYSNMGLPIAQPPQQQGQMQTPQQQQIQMPQVPPWLKNTAMGAVTPPPLMGAVMPQMQALQMGSELPPATPQDYLMGAAFPPMRGARIIKDLLPAPTSINTDFNPFVATQNQNFPQEAQVQQSWADPEETMKPLVYNTNTRYEEKDYDEFLHFVKTFRPQEYTKGKKNVALMLGEQPKAINNPFVKGASANKTFEEERGSGQLLKGTFNVNKIDTIKDQGKRQFVSDMLTDTKNVKKNIRQVLVRSDLTDKDKANILDRMVRMDSKRDYDIVYSKDFGFKQVNYNQGKPNKKEVVKAVNNLNRGKAEIKGNWKSMQPEWESLKKYKPKSGIPPTFDEV